MYICTHERPKAVILDALPRGVGWKVHLFIYTSEEKWMKPMSVNKPHISLSPAGKLIYWIVLNEVMAGIKIAGRKYLRCRTGVVRRKPVAALRQIQETIGISGAKVSIEASSFNLASNVTVRRNTSQCFPSL